MGIEVSPWLKSLPVAPEYYPTLAEFQDPIAYIFKIEKEASKFGICKIIPPVPPAPRKTAIGNLNRSLVERAGGLGDPVFNTRMQQIGFCPRKHNRPVHKPVWESGESYTLGEFEAKAKLFEKGYLKKSWKKGGVSALEIESVYWKATLDKPFSVEYANDMPGSAFVFRKEGCDGNVGNNVSVGETDWNMRCVSRAKGSLLRFMKEEIPGVTSPMVYIAMMFSWFAWHVEDHDLHSLNYLHTGAGKTWYGVPRDAAVAFEEVVRVHGYGGEINPIVTFSTLAQKTTVMSPEVFVNAGVPCCRLVQNPGEFVVTFPRAYHSGFSHGFNCGEASNIATPEWLMVAKDAAIRRASMNCPPMVSHFQLLYDLALSLCSRVPRNIRSEPRSARLKDKKKGEGDILVKDLFVDDVLQNNSLFHTIGKGSSVIVLPQMRPGSSFKVKAKLFPSLCNSDVVVKTMKDSIYGDPQSDRVSHQGLFYCTTCGILCFSSVAIVQPTETASRYLASGDCTRFSDCVGDDSLVAFDGKTTADQNQPVDVNNSEICNTGMQKGTSSLGLLAMTYGDCSDSEDDDAEADVPVRDTEIKTSEVKRVDPTRDDDSSRMHIFCLQHAVQVEKQLQAIGGSNVVLLCHPDYPMLEAEAKHAADELGKDNYWNDISYREASLEDEEIIQSILDSEESVQGNGDWAVKLGINLYYTANLSRSPLYSKQMPYNSMIYSAFGRKSEEDTSDDEKLPGRERKVIVAGKWCGKVWTASQVHPMLIEGELEEQDHMRNSPIFKKPRLMIERSSDSLDEVFEDELEGGPSTRLRKRTAKPSRFKEGVRKKKSSMRVEDEYQCDIENCTMSFVSKQELVLHKKNVCPVKGCGKKFFSHKYLVQHRRVHMDDRPLKCPWKGCNMTFKWAWARTEHIRVHTGERPYVCTVSGCGQTFRFVSDFSRHKRKTGHAPKKVKK